MLKIIPPPRGSITPKVRSDKAGEGHYGAKRRGRIHTGIDFVAPPGSKYLAPCDGEITAHGFPYEPVPGETITYRIIDLKDVKGYIHRAFYCKMLPGLLHRRVKKDDVIGIVQDITAKYPDQGMTNHVHYAVRNLDGTYMDPKEYWDAH